MIVDKIILGKCKIDGQECDFWQGFVHPVDSELLDMSK